MTGVEPDRRSDDRAALDRLARAMTRAGDRELQHRLVGSRKHRSSVNLLVDLIGDDGERRLFIKRLRSHAFTRYQQADVGADRPRLKPVADPASRLADEAVAMQAIHRMVEKADRDDWFAVPVVAVSDCPDLLVLERIDVPTMAEQLDRAAPDAMMDRAARSIGAWLHAFHRLTPDFPHARPLFAHSAELVNLTAAMIDQVGDRRLERRGDRIMEAVSALPSTLELAPSHGDLNPGNVFVTDGGAIAVFDTAAEWTMPVHVDLANLTVTLEFAGYKRPLTRTLATAERLAGQVRIGYGPDAPPRRELLAFELVVLLDRWCSLGERGGRSSVRSTVAQWFREQILAAGLSAGIDRRLDQLGDV
ncbi:MAG: aminoglycoside phosphotransferase family protein [Acidimicrobiia bacterium]|nr:aminoglycoside phosphotransferase family protein [Acidimicrobiia bacterium]